MKISKIVLVLAVSVLGFISCKKDEVVKSMEGTWEGRWGFGYETPTFYEKWELKKNGDLESFYPNGEVYATGEWDLDGDEFEARYSPIGENYTYIFTGSYDEGSDEITGTWGETEDQTNGGTFEMERN